MVRIGTVSGAADVWGVHHATVARHVDTLEAGFRVKLFQRHARGYTPTVAGLDLLQVVKVTQNQILQLEGRLKRRGDTDFGEFVITSVEKLAPLLVPALGAFERQYPAVCLRYLTSGRLFRLEFG